MQGGSLPFGVEEVQTRFCLLPCPWLWFSRRGWGIQGGSGHSLSLTVHPERLGGLSASKGLVRTLLLQKRPDPKADSFGFRHRKSHIGKTLSFGCSWTLHNWQMVGRGQSIPSRAILTRLIMTGMFNIPFKDICCAELECNAPSGCSKPSP